jgi:hypothetical protein
LHPFFIKTFAGAMEVNASSCFLYSACMTHPEASLSLHFVLSLMIKSKAIDFATFFCSSALHLSIVPEAG